MSRYTVRGSNPGTGVTLEVYSETIEYALIMADALAKQATDVRIFADGVPLPSYGEALAQREEVLAEVDKALAYAEGGQRVAKPPVLSGVRRGALLAIREMLRGAR